MLSRVLSCNNKLIETIIFSDCFVVSSLRIKWYLSLFVHNNVDLFIQISLEVKIVICSRTEIKYIYLSIQRCRYTDHHHQRPSHLFSLPAPHPSAPLAPSASVAPAPAFPILSPLPHPLIWLPNSTRALLRSSRKGLISEKYFFMYMKYFDIFISACDTSLW